MMTDWIVGYQKGVAEGGRGLRDEEWNRLLPLAPEHPPEELRALYSAFDGGELNGGVRLFPYERVVEGRNSSEDSSWVFGEKGQQRLLAARKATLAAHPGLIHRPTWFETTSADALVFAVHDSRAGTLRVYPSLEQLLSVVVPPAQLEAFGDQTYARAMAAVEHVIEDVVKKVKPKAKVKAAAPPKKQKPVKKKPAPKKKPVKKPVKKPGKAKRRR